MKKSNAVLFLQTLLLSLFLFVVFSCSNPENNSMVSEFELSGEKTEISVPNSGIDSASGKNSPIIKLKVPGDNLFVNYPENSPTILLFVAHWCPYCQEEIPEVVKWIEEDQIIQKGVNVVLIATSTDSGKSNYPPDEWLFNEKWQYPVIYDDANNQIADYFGVSYFPSWVFTENDGLIAFTHAGKITKEELSNLVN
ncbi:MAG: hypothetical protein CL773_04505 [Chloroflexi bacterium]|nr:hypothetical protein [Chloroflexota bacterium]